MADKTISSEELERLIDLNKSYILIDVREPYEVESYGAIPTSHNIPLDEIKEALNLQPIEFEIKYHFKKPTNNSLLIFHCRSGSRSQVATELALSLGFNAKNYQGSILEWADMHPDGDVIKY
ncbi:MAG: rhodanese-like domain-containing protein [Nanoarchaeota archaeon]